MCGQQGWRESHVSPCRPGVQQVSDQGFQSASAEPSGGTRGRQGDLENTEGHTDLPEPTASCLG